MKLHGNKTTIHKTTKWQLGFNPWDLGSILAQDESRDILNNPNISWFNFSSIEIWDSLISIVNTQI